MHPRSHRLRRAKNKLRRPGNFGAGMERSGADIARNARVSGWHLTRTRGCPAGRRFQRTFSPAKSSAGFGLQNVSRGTALRANCGSFWRDKNPRSCPVLTNSRARVGIRQLAQATLYDPRKPTRKNSMNKMEHAVAGNAGWEVTQLQPVEWLEDTPFELPVGRGPVRQDASSKSGRNGNYVKLEFGILDHRSNGGIARLWRRCRNRHLAC